MTGAADIFCVERTHSTKSPHGPVTAAHHWSGIYYLFDQIRTFDHLSHNQRR
jgi:hypothetical protein